MKKEIFEHPPLWVRKTLRVARGLASDYWNDGTWKANSAPAFPKVEIDIDPPPYMTSQEAKNWLEDIIRVREVMWGAGCVLPGGVKLIDAMILPMGVTKDIAILDMAAGLGYVGRYISEKYGTYVDGLDPDAKTAERGNEMSVRAGVIGSRAPVEFYDPNAFKEDKHYACVFMRELVYRIKDKKRFLKEISKTLRTTKPNGRAQLAFTDYILEDEMLTHPAVVSWLDAEKGAAPVSLALMKKMLAQVGLDVRVSDDITAEHLDAIRGGLKALLSFMKVHTLSMSDVSLVKAEVELWAARAAALEQGLKLYRFYAFK